MRPVKLIALLTVGSAVGVLQTEANAQDFPPNGTIVWHNGSTDSSPPGSGHIDVRLDYGVPAGGPIKVFYGETASLDIEFEYPDGSPSFLWAASRIHNHTPIPWSQFEVVLAGADFAGHDWDTLATAPATDPVVDIGFGSTGLLALSSERIAIEHIPASQFSLLGSTIERFNPPGTEFADSKLTITFDDPIQPDKAFVLHYNVIPSPGAPDPTGFTMSMRPIPEPATLALVGAPMVVLLCLRRKKLQAPPYGWILFQGLQSCKMKEFAGRGRPLLPVT